MAAHLLEQMAAPLYKQGDLISLLGAGLLP
jgi:hypothetical protein